SSPERFEIEGADGGPLRGDLYQGVTRGGEPRAVLLCHGFRGYKDWGFIPLLASTLAAQGATAVAFNMTGSGIVDADGVFVERERFRKSTYSAELEDLDRVARWLSRRITAGGRPAALGLIGHSRGGAMAILYAASHPEVRTVVALAAPSRIGVWPDAAFEAWREGRPHVVRDFRARAELPLGPEIYDDIARNGARYDLQRAAAMLTIPLLVVQGDRDRSVPVEEGRALASWGPPATTELAIIEGAGHSFQAGDKIRRTPPQLLEMIERVSAWVRRTMEPDAREARP
ncbi:MAG TPA: alpha/beta fold hydrolase, partial [Candidatus Eisenbacteria bacterium]|nr:alpha/beta fold hydrolase [Candidatus Eisenbacteria bacterium]